MAFSMHSHSGQFCPGHAKDELEAIIQHAISLKMQLFCLTEHMPRTSELDRYPEEISGEYGLDLLPPRHEAYIKEAVRLRNKYKDEIEILIGFEGEWIRPDYEETIRELLKEKEVDFFIGSVHHVHNIPIDYDRALYIDARSVSGGTDTQLFEDYFDSHFEMLKALKPPVVAHFDLIRLFSDDSNINLKEMGGEVWKKVVRNLELIKDQGGLLEVNSAGLRKGMREPYPTRAICEEFMRIGGFFTLSDDSHGIAQVGTNFKGALDYLHGLGLQEIHFLHAERSEQHGSTLRIASAPLLSIHDGTLMSSKQILAAQPPDFRSRSRSRSS